MTRGDTRIRIDDDGRLEVVDPGFESLDLLRGIDPDFLIRSTPLGGFTTPRFLNAIGLGVGLDAADLGRVRDDVLLATHASAVGRTSDAGRRAAPPEGEASLMELKIELARRALSRCHLCAHRCGVDRLSGEAGACRLGTEASVAEHFVHIAEESPINPSLVLNLAGCGLRCRFCQQWAILEPRAVDGDRLGPSLWPALSVEGARSISFVGGNPDESLYSILRFLNNAPGSWMLPVVWNSHGYSTPETLALLNGVVDAYLPDFKYGSEECGLRLSGVRGYPQAAKESVTQMVGQGVPVIIRILVLGGHYDCCHKPALEFLTSLGSRNVTISVRDQYSPDWKVKVGEGDLSRRIRPDEASAVRELALSLNLTLVD